MPTTFIHLSGGEGHDDLNGTSGDDILKGFGGADILNAGSANDFLQGGKGPDVLNGGAGIDTADYQFSNASVIISLANNTAVGGEAQGDVLSSIENLIGSGYGDGLAGDSAANVLQGGGGDDILNGLGGNDVIEGGDGADVLQGGDGIDTLSYASARARVTVGLTPNVPRNGDAFLDSTPLWDFENITGSAYDDAISGNAISNVLDGGGGSDSLFGAGGNDLLRGGTGDDSLWGNEGADQLIGQGGKDQFGGGQGADLFSWFSTSETGTTIGTADRIRDFNFAEGDRIDLLNVDADVYAAGDQAFTLIGTAAFSGTPGEIRYFHANGGTVIEMQTGTSPDVEGMIFIDGFHAPLASWFIQ